jgi:hypothetical protein
LGFCEPDGIKYAQFVLPIYPRNPVLIFVNPKFVLIAQSIKIAFFSEVEEPDGDEEEGEH